MRAASSWFRGKTYLPVTIVASCLLFLGACASPLPDPGQFESSRTLQISPERLQLVRIARAMIGVPYRYGGSRPEQGFDCSGLVFYSYRLGGVAVPRTTAQQRQHATPVAASGLRPGDLVFFDTRAKEGHVGIYTGRGRFIHAPSSGGSVREERLTNPYWRKRWLGGGNLLDG